MGRKKTTEEFILDAKLKHGDRYCYDKVEYINDGEKVCIICKESNHGEFWQIPSNHIKKNNPTGCPKCYEILRGSKTRKDIEQVIFEFKKYNLTLDDNYINGSSPVKCVDNDGYLIYVRLSDLNNNQNYSRFEKSNPYTIDNIKLWLSINRPVYLLKDGQKYLRNNSNLIFICPIHGEFPMSWANIQNFKNCGYCRGLRVNDTNSLYTLRPDLLKCIVDEKDAKNVTTGSHKTILCKCPNCGIPKSMNVNQLCSNGFSCSKCSDNISFGEKILIGIFKQLDIEFETQKIFKWSNKKRYDLYCHQYNVLCEVNGRQHYEESTLTKRTLKEEQENDLLKYNLATTNNIRTENYIVIDARKSDFEFIKNNCLLELSKIFDLSNINWEEVLECTCHNLQVESWKLWNERGINETTQSIVTKLNSNRSTVIKWLKNGTKLNKCNYSAIDEIFKCGRNSGIASGKKIGKYDKDLNLIETFYSGKEASRITGLSQGNISSCATGNSKYKHVGGFIWRYMDSTNEGECKND